MHDTFSTLAKHYDAMMSHVDYERWIAVSTLIADLCPDEDFLHIDIGCGTGHLVQGLREYGWRSIGADLSMAMLRSSSEKHGALPMVQADMTRMPFRNGFHFATCVFDSVNFLLDPTDLTAAMRAARQTMTDQGIFYFDYISEVLVKEHYADHDWTDDNNGVATRWQGHYDEEARIIKNIISFDGKNATTVQERVHTHEEIEAALDAAGLHLLARLDNTTWAEPIDETLRYDVVASVQPPDQLEKEFRYIQQDIQVLLADVE